MSAYTHPVPRTIPNVVRHLVWFTGVCVVAFLVPYLGVVARRRGGARRTGAEAADAAAVAALRPS